MAVPAPVCNTTVFAPAPSPSGPKGFKTIPLNATLDQIIRIVNDNFSPLVQQKTFNQLLADDIARGTGTRTGGTQAPSLVAKAAQNELSKLAFTELSIIRKKVRVENPNDSSQYIIDDRVQALVMRDARTGATWTFKDPGA